VGGRGLWGDAPKKSAVSCTLRDLVGIPLPRGDKVFDDS